MLTAEQVVLLIKAKKENYKRGAEMLRWILEKNKQPTAAHDSTIRRTLRVHGFDRQWRRKKPKVLLPMDIKKPMEVWMGDFSPGPYLPHPLNVKKKARTHLCLWHDAGGHMIMQARYYWEESEFNAILTLRDAMIRYGIPSKIYIDQGSIAGEQVKRIAAYFGITYVLGTPYHPEGRAHAERQFRSIQDAFESELKINPVSHIDTLNQQFEAWQEEFWYGYTKKGIETRKLFFQNKPQTSNIRPEEYTLFLYEKEVTVRRNSLVHLEGMTFWVDPPLSGKKVVAYYNPQDLSQIEIWVNQKRYQIAYPFDPNSLAYKLCRQMSQRNIEQEKGVPVCNVLKIMKEKYQPIKMDSGVEQFIQILEHALARPLEVVQQTLAKKFWEDYGPFRFEEVSTALKQFTSKKGTGLHVDYYLDTLKKLPRGNEKGERRC